MIAFTKQRCPKCGGYLQQELGWLRSKLYLWCGVPKCYYKTGNTTQPYFEESKLNQLLCPYCPKEGMTREEYVRHVKTHL
jgi:hypothetical protein